MAADRPHRPRHSKALVHQHPAEGGGAAPMRIPVAVQTREARGGAWLVHRGPVGHPRIALGDGPRVVCQRLRKFRVQKVGVGGARPVMQKTDDGPNAKPAQPPQPPVGPGPIEIVRPPRGDAFPQHGIAQAGDAKLGNQPEILLAFVVAGFAGLIAPCVADADDAALDAAPQLHAGHYEVAGAAADEGADIASPAGRRIKRRPMRSNVASACPTTWSML